MHQAELYRYLRYLGAESPAVAEDLVQDTFLAAWKSTSPPASEEPRLLAAWLRGIARNLFLNHCRRKKANPVKVSAETVESAESVWTSEFLREGDGFETIQALRQCLETLPGDRQELLRGFYAEGKSRAELARLHRMTEDGVKTFMRRIRDVLGECIRRRLAAEGVA